jgi:glutathionyl-hydroquinone reductase
MPAILLSRHGVGKLVRIVRACLTGRVQVFDRVVQVPVLWDKQAQKIVSNESADIIRMFATEFGAFHKPGEAHDLRRIHAAGLASI